MKTNDSIKRNKKRMINFLKLVVSISILYLLFYVTRLDQLEESFLKIGVITIVLTVIVYFSSILLSVKRWQILNKKAGIIVNDTELYRSYLIGAFFNNFMPSSIGGDVSKLFTIKVDKGQKVQLGVTVIGERFAGLLTNLILGISFGVFLINEDEIVFTVWIILLVGFIALLVLFLLRTKIKKIGNLVKLYDLLPKGVRTKLEKILNVLSSFQLSNRELIKLFLYSTLIGATSVISLNLYLSDMGYPILISPLFFMVASTMIISLIPISLNAIGIKEFGYVVVMGIFGISRPDALAIAIVSRVTMIVTSLIGGILVLLQRQKGS